MHSGKLEQGPFPFLKEAETSSKKARSLGLSSVLHRLLSRLDNHGYRRLPSRPVVSHQFHFHSVHGAFINIRPLSTVQARCWQHHWTWWREILRHCSIALLISINRADACVTSFHWALRLPSAAINTRPDVSFRFFGRSTRARNLRPRRQRSWMTAFTSAACKQDTWQFEAATARAAINYASVSLSIATHRDWCLFYASLHLLYRTDECAPKQFLDKSSYRFLRLTLIRAIQPFDEIFDETSRFSILVL